MRKYNILMVELDRDLGGSVISTLTLASELKAMGNNVAIVIPKHNAWQHLIAQYDIPFYIVDAWPAVKRISDPMTFKKKIIKAYKDYINYRSENEIESIIKLNKIDIVHMATLNYECGARAARKQGVRLVWHIREFLEEDHGTEWICPSKSKKLISSADAIITISDAINNKYSNILDSNTIYKVYNGIDFDKYYTKRKLFDSPKIKCAIFGRLSKGKGQDEFIDAAKKCPADKFEFHIVGSGDTSQYDAQGYSNITFDGHTDRPEESMKQMDIICVCSRNEAFGRVTVEAKAAGALVIGTNTGGTVELIKHGRTGLLYQQGNSTDLANILKWVSENRDAASIIACDGQKDASDRFTAQANAKNIMLVYQSVFE